jgi:tRNA-modifying protein YgfZ
LIKNMNKDEIVKLIDPENWAILELTGKDRQQFLHNQTTNDINSLSVGQGIDSVFVNSTARTLDLATIYNLEDAIWILVSRERREFLYQWIDRYIFPADQVQIQDITAKYRVLKIIGKNSEELLQQVMPFELTAVNYGDHQSVGSIRIAVGTGLDLPGYTLFIAEQEYSSYKERLLALGMVELSPQEQEELRITQGRPHPGRELTEDYNALEAGLWRAISFTKGCYIGQETIARLNTYQGVKQRLWGISLDKQVPEGSPIYLEQERIGTVTSCQKTISGEVIGLAYIKSKAGGEGLEIEVDHRAQGKIISVPYLSHDYYRP